MKQSNKIIAANFQKLLISDRHLLVYLAIALGANSRCGNHRRS